ncbi:MAG: hypothetical protein ACI9LY_002196 [Arenicella sp.]|jgi:uncharacterized protein YceH (UPF0502 family)
MHQLSILQTRVLACLMEKHLATPNNYPLTLNSLMLACNQKTNRGDVMSLSEGQVGHTVKELEDLNLVRSDYGDRAMKVSHRAPAVLNLERETQAILAMLMLREPLTLADIRARTERMVNFESIEELKMMVDDLIEREQPLLSLIPKGPGQREDRYTHLFLGTPDIEALNQASKNVKDSHAEQVKQLKARISELEDELAGYRNT